MTIGTTFLERLRHNAEKHGGLTAIREIGRSISYEDLEHDSNRVARTLLERGLLNGGVVAIAIPRGIDLIKCQVAVLKAGGAFFSIDVNLPPARKEELIRLVAPKIVIHEGGNEPATNWDCLKLGLDELETQDGSALGGLTFSADDPAYVICTSGSTGSPRAVLLPRSGLDNHVQCYIDQFDLFAESRVLQFADCGFDAYVSEMAIALGSGGMLQILPAATRASFTGFQEYVEGEGITFVTLPPFYLSRLDPRRMTGIQTLLSAGDSLPHDVAVSWRKRRHLFNAYGPSETSICATLFRCDGREDVCSSVPIGAPIKNVVCYLAEPDGAIYPYSEAPTGRSLELLIGGVGVALRYIGHSVASLGELEANGHGRLFRTGDIASKNELGLIEFHGRCDRQVKILGVRVSLTEVEKHLQSHPEVLDVHLSVDRSGKGEEYLRAYIESRVELRTADMRSYLSGRLPPSLHPKFFEFMKELPRNASGKVDRSLLPARIERQGTRSAGNAVFRRREHLIDLWKRQLDVQTIRMSDDFFDLGGDSLDAMEIASMMGRDLGIFANAKDVYTHRQLHSFLKRFDTPEPGRKQFDLPEPAKVYGASEYRCLLSPQQKQIYAIHQRDPISLAYNVTLAYRFAQGFDDKQLSVLRSSLQALVDLHSILRSSFHLNVGGVYRVIHEDIRVELDLLLRDKAYRPELECADLAQAELARPFDLAVAPLFRASVISTSPMACILLFDFHHIVMDGASIELFANQLQALASGVVLSAPEIKYEDYLAYLKEYERSARYLDDKEFWRAQLAAASRSLEIGSMSQSATAHDSGAHTAQVYLCPMEFEKVRHVAQRCRVPMGALLLACFAMTLSKQAESVSQFVIGCTSRGRPDHRFRQAMGMFVRTLSVRIDLEHDATVLAAIQSIAEQLNRAIEHEDYPLYQIVSDLNAESHLGLSPLFDAMFTMRRQEENITVAGSNGVPVGVIMRDTVSELLLDVVVGAKDCRILFRCLKTRSSKAFVERFIMDYEQHLEIISSLNVLSQPLRKLSPDLGEDQQLHSVGETRRVSKNSNATVSELIELTERRHPGRVAVRDDDGEITYAQLGQRVERVVSQLAALGVEEGSIVGLCLERTRWTVITMLAVLRMRAAFLPVDISTPVARVQEMFRRGCAKVVVCDAGSPLIERASLLAKLEGFEDLRPLSIVRIPSDSLNNDPSEDFRFSNCQHRILYVICTSGSTGIPKSVIIRDAAFVNLLDWAFKEFEFSASDIVLCVNSIAFDLSMFDVLGFLACGGTIRLASDCGRRDPEYVLDRLKHESITFWNSAPAAAEALLTMASGKLRSSESMRLVFLSGDWVRPRLVRMLQGVFPNAKIVALGGATETTVWSNYFVVDQLDPMWHAIPYGKPIQNVSYHILDRFGRPSPVEVAGELYIGGDCLSVGYLNDPASTDKAFVTMEILGEAKALYRTGDFVRLDDHGIIHFLGRRDRQVKIRGHRVELGEVESAISRIVGIDGCVVDSLAKGGGPQLVGYYISAAGVPPASVRSSLASDLPLHLIPSLLYRVARIPVDRNGKIDRSAIRAEVLSDADPQLRVAAKDEVEALISEIWNSVLDVEELSVHDNVFKSGADSILAVQAFALLSQRFTLAMHELYLYPTIAELAGILRERPTDIQSRVSQIRAWCKKAALPFSPSPSSAPIPIGKVAPEILPNQHVLLTGVTGSLGMELFRLATSSDAARVTVLGRRKEFASLEARVEHIWMNRFHERRVAPATPVDFVEGDLRNPKLGLSDLDYARLASSVDCIINSAADTRVYGPLNELRSINTDGAKRLLDFAAIGRRKTLHHVSTIAVRHATSASSRSDGVFDERNFDFRFDGCRSSYVSTKAQAEIELQVSPELRRVYRLGAITFNSRLEDRSIELQHSAFYRIVRSFVKLGCLPLHDAIRFPLMPVDDVALALWHLVRSKSGHGHFHLLGSSHFGGEALSRILIGIGYNVETVPLDEFVIRIESALHNPRLRAAAADVIVHLFEPLLDPALGFPACAATDFELARAGFNWRVMDENSLRCHLSTSHVKKFIEDLL